MKQKITYLTYPLLLLLLVLTGWQFRQVPVPNDVELADINLPNFQKSKTENGMWKFENQDALVYIKPAVKAFQGSHDPRICWSGSGYEFTKVKTTEIDGQKIYTAILTKGEDERLVV